MATFFGVIRVAMKNLILLSLLVSTTTFAQNSFDERVSAAYRRADNNFDLDCYYRNNKVYGLVTPVSTTTKGSNFLKRDFIISNGQSEVPMTFHVMNVGNKKKFQYNLYIEHKVVSSGVTDDKDFYIGPVNDNNVTNEFQTSKLFCNLNLAEDAPHTLAEGNVHINVHPHLRYDPRSLLRPAAESKFTDESIPHILLLESANERDDKVNINDFFQGKSINLKPINYPLSVKAVPSYVNLIVAPAGHNRYVLEAQNELNVTFTGGNHNFCMFNNTRHILDSLMMSTSNAKIVINFPVDKIIAQQLGVKGQGIDFPKSMTKVSYHLKELFKNEAVALKYHQNYFNHFRGEFLDGYLGQFKSVRLIYSSKLFSQDVVVYGNGTRELDIEMNYIND